MTDDVGSVSVVLPVHNERDVIERVVRGYWTEVVARLPDGELIVAEDGSTDGTKEVLDALRREIPFRLASGVERKGYLRGVRDALLLAEKEWIFFSDTDGTHDPADFWTLSEKAREGFDLVAGEKIDRRDARYRLAFSRGWNGLVRAATGVRIRDLNGGFKLLRRDLARAVVPAIRHLPQGFSTELVVRAHARGARIASVPVRHLERTTGRADQFEPRQMPRVVWRMGRGLVRLVRETRRTRGA